MPAENSEVLKRLLAPACDDGSAVRLVAVAVTICPGFTAVGAVNVNDALPELLLVTVAAPRKVCPSATPLRGSELLTKNSMRYLTLGEAGWFRVPTMVVPSGEIDVSTGKFWKLLGSKAAPWLWESLAVTPSSLGKTNPLLRSMPASKFALLRPFSKI